MTIRKLMKSEKEHWLTDLVANNLNSIYLVIMAQIWDWVADYERSLPHTGGSRWWLKGLGSFLSHGRPRWNSRLWGKQADKKHRYAFQTKHKSEYFSLHSHVTVSGFQPQLRSQCGRWEAAVPSTWEALTEFWAWPSSHCCRNLGNEGASFCFS